MSSSTAFLGSSTADTARERESGRRALLVFLGTLSQACAGFGGSPDNPNRDDSALFHGTAVSWKVTDEGSSAVLAEGCSGSQPVPTVHVPVGARVLLETSEELTTKTEAPSSPDGWCSDEDLESRAPAGVVKNLECWSMVDTGPLVILSWEAVPTPTDLGPPSTHQMKGRGVRLSIEVREHGSLVLEPNGTCTVQRLPVLTAIE